MFQVRLFPVFALGLVALLLAAPSSVGAHTVSLVATPAASGGDFAKLVDIGGEAVQPGYSTGS